MPDSCFSKWKDKEELDIARFYKVSGLNRSDVIRVCSEAGVAEDEFITTLSKTTKYAYQKLFYALYELFELKEFWVLFVIFWIGLGLIFVFIK